MNGIQRDHIVNGDWTNSEGYNDGTAGAALNNIMREQVKRPPAPPSKPPVTRDGETKYIQVTPRNTTAAKAKVKTPPPPTSQKTPDEAALKTARTVYTIIQMVARLQGLTVEAITLRDKAEGRMWNKADLDAPTPKR